MDLAAQLPHLLPRAIAWAKGQSRQSAKRGRKLTPQEQDLARAVGVTKPERIRVAVVATLPLPDDLELRAAALHTGLLGPGMTGLTLGYAVIVCHDHETTRLLSHEFRHVYQYEQAGGIAAFLPPYLEEIVRVGYHNTSFERDAAAHERDH
jgi:hypothetical protein